MEAVPMAALGYGRAVAAKPAPGLCAWRNWKVEGGGMVGGLGVQRRDFLMKKCSTGKLTLPFGSGNRDWPRGSLVSWPG